MENILYIEFIAYFNKEIYQNSSWKTREEFFAASVINYVDDDLHFYSKNYENMDCAQKEKYNGFIQTIKEIKCSIQESIKYELIELSGSMEKVKISFNFKYFENSIMSSEQTVNALIFNKAITTNTFLSTDLLRFAQKERKDAVESLCKIYAHVAELMEAAKPYLVVKIASIET